MAIPMREARSVPDPARDRVWPPELHYFTHLYRLAGPRGLPGRWHGHIFHFHKWTNIPWTEPPFLTPAS
jgi:hypothetical protein